MYKISNKSHSVRSLILLVVKHKKLLYELTKRDVVVRFKGSKLGILWTIIPPLFMLAIYSFVFSSVFQSKWPHYSGNSITSFACILFVGLLIHTFYVEALSRSSMVIQEHPNYVKKIVFPLELLPLIAVASAGFRAVVSLLVLVMVLVFSQGFVHWSSLAIILVLIALTFHTVGLCLFVAALGVFVKDLSHFIGILGILLLFVSPIFYPLSSLPIDLGWVVYLNPLTFAIEESRSLLIFGNGVNWAGLAIYYTFGILFVYFGIRFFSNARAHYSDYI
jgi:lipopolysaccharide transport system permease protein